MNELSDIFTRQLAKYEKQKLNNINEKEGKFPHFDKRFIEQPHLWRQIIRRQINFVRVYPAYFWGWNRPIRPIDSSASAIELVLLDIDIIVKEFTEFFALSMVEIQWPTREEVLEFLYEKASEPKIPIQQQIDELGIDYGGTKR